MYNVLIKLIVAAALLELGITLSQSDDLSFRTIWDRLQRASHKVARIEWKPIFIFPEEAQRFQSTPEK